VVVILPVRYWKLWRGWGMAGGAGQSAALGRGAPVYYMPTRLFLKRWADSDVVARLVCCVPGAEEQRAAALPPTF
jgi:hypothetical protein